MISELLSGNDFPTKIPKRYNSISDVEEVTCLLLCTSFDSASHLYQVS